MFKLILVLILTISIIENKERKSFKDLVDIYLKDLEISNAYLSYNQYISLLNKLKNDFPNYLELSSIGKTYEGNEMPLIIMKSPINPNIDYNKDINSTENNNNNNTITNNTDSINKTNITNNPLYNKSGIFFNGMHHGREQVSMMMNIYIILHLLSLPKTYLHLFLSSTNIYFLPIINIDAYKYNCEKYYKNNNTFGFLRKNRHPHKSKKCDEEGQGVDLNRNYDYFFGENSQGSSNYPCSEMYRGEYPFSESETYHPNIKIAFNYHTWGNIMITPFNHLKRNDSLTILKNEFPIHYKMYEHFKEEANFPVNFLFGNCQKTLGYMSNGEATDWFLGKKSILSFSPELGNGKKSSNTFSPNRNITMDILEKNLYSALYAIQKSMFFIKSELIKAEYSPCSYSSNTYNDIYFNRKSFFENDDLKDIELKNCIVQIN